MSYVEDASRYREFDLRLGTSGICLLKRVVDNLLRVSNGRLEKHPLGLLSFRRLPATSPGIIWQDDLSLVLLRVIAG